MYYADELLLGQVYAQCQFLGTSSLKSISIDIRFAIRKIRNIFWGITVCMYILILIIIRNNFTNFFQM